AFGLPQRIRTDNGVPFASAHALYGLSKMSVGWWRLGIQIEPITPGHPQQNGRHERMHLTLKKEATKHAAANVLQQQARFDTFVQQYNHDRPHQALEMKVPADVYTRSLRVYRGPRRPDLTVSRSDDHGDPLRAGLFQGAEGQSQPGVRRPERRRHAGRRAHLARHLHAVRFGLLRRRDVPAGTDRESVRAESVTYVSG